MDTSASNFYDAARDRGLLNTGQAIDLGRDFDVGGDVDAIPVLDDWRRHTMTSALAAAKRELDRSRASLDQELSRNPDYAALRSLDRSPDAGTSASIQQRQILAGRLEALPLFQALQAVIAANAHIAATDLGESGQAGAADSGRAVAPPAPSPPRPRPSFTPPDGPAQPLTAIRGLSLAIAKDLLALGITRYEQIADWRAEDVQDVGAALDLGRTISQRNWIEQAALLAMRAPEGWRPASPVKAPLPPARPVPVEASVPVFVPAEPVPSDLLMVEAVPASAPKPRPPGYSDMLRIVACAVTAATTGADTALAAMPVRPVPAPELATVTSETVDPEEATRASSPLLDADPGPVTLTAPPPTPLPSPPIVPVADEVVPEILPADPLHHIHDIDQAMAQKLAEAGVGQFSAISAWRAADLSAIAPRLDVSVRRINREGWIEQAAILATGRDTAFSRRMAQSGAGERNDVYPLHYPPLLYPMTPAAPALEAMLRPNPEVMAPVTVAPVQLPTSPAASPAMSSRIDERPILLSEGGDLGHDPNDSQTAAGIAESSLDRIGKIDRSLTRMIEEELTIPAVEEATVTFIARPTAAPPPVEALAAKAASHEPAKPPPLIFRPPPRPARSPHAGLSKGEPAASRAKGVASFGDDTTRKPGTDGEEALVEIIRRNDPLAPAGGGAAAKAAIDRVPPLQANSRPGTNLPDAQQPAWITEKKDEAGGVVRRFLKAIKRNA
jgi:predicted flap endonuclease-1-like 5' DNA nuclease